MLAGLDNKNPSVKAETAAFLGRCFAKCNATILNKKILKAYCPALVKTLNESGNLLLSFFKLLSLIPLFQICSLDPSVRDSSAEALGVAMKVVGEKIIMPFLPDLEAMKMAKIREEVEEKAAAILPPEVMTGITDSNWKTRLSSMESLMQVIENKYLKII